MPAATVDVVHGLYAGSTFLSQITGSRVVSGIDVLTGVAGGHPYPLFQAIRNQTPMIELTTTQLATALDMVALVGADLSGGSVDFFLKRTVDHGLRVAAGTSAHTRYRASNCFLGWDSLSCDLNGEGSINLRAYCIWDGSNEPLVPANSQTLSGTPSSAEYFAAGPCVINSVQFAGVQSITVDLQPTYTVVFADGEVWPTLIYVSNVNPRVTVTTVGNPWGTVGLDGAPITGATFYLRKLAENGTRVADNVGQHISITGEDGLLFCDDTSAGNNDPAETTFVCQFSADDASSLPLTFDTSATIA